MIRPLSSLHKLPSPTVSKTAVLHLSRELVHQCLGYSRHKKIDLICQNKSLQGLPKKALQWYRLPSLHQSQIFSSTKRPYFKYIPLTSWWTASHRFCILGPSIPSWFYKYALCYQCQNQNALALLYSLQRFPYPHYWVSLWYASEG